MKRRNLKDLKKRTRRKSIQLKEKSKQYYSSGSSKKSEKVASRKFISPQNLSIFENSEESLEYFGDIINFLKDEKSKSQYKTLYIDMENVDNITIDAIMYLIAMMKNVKSYSDVDTEFSGSLPKNDKVLHIVQDSGFFKYVKSLSDTSLRPNSNYFQIITGKLAEPDDATQICSYVGKKLGVDKIVTRHLYGIVLELMKNTLHHAYKEKGAWAISDWYICVENTNTTLNFIFLDTGEGIPETVRKKWYEKAIPRKDSEYIRSAIRGEFRTATGEPYRGNGLPEVFKACQNGHIQNLKIISGRGFFGSNGADIELSDKKMPLVGTLFYWEIEKHPFERGA